MNAYVSKEELSLLPTNQISHGDHYADARSQRRGMFSAVTRWIGAYVERQRVLAELSHLSDRELADIGLARSELPGLVATSFTRSGR